MRNSKPVIIFVRNRPAQVFRLLEISVFRPVLFQGIRFVAICETLPSNLHIPLSKISFFGQICFYLRGNGMRICVISKGIGGSVPG